MSSHLVFTKVNFSFSIYLIPQFVRNLSETDFLRDPQWSLIYKSTWRVCLFCAQAVFWLNQRVFIKCHMNKLWTSSILWVIPDSGEGKILAHDPDKKRGGVVFSSIEASTLFGGRVYALTWTLIFVCTWYINTWLSSNSLPCPCWQSLAFLSLYYFHVWCKHLFWVFSWSSWG